MKKLTTLAAVLVLTSSYHLSQAQGDEPNLHVNSRWKECSFQLDPSLTQKAWREFTREAGLVAYFRPLVDAKPMVPGHFEVAVLSWLTGFDETKDAWNNTFVHPDSTHWLKESPRLAFPGLSARVGITDKLDAGVYFTKNPGANYGFFGGQLQYNILNERESGWSASTRAGFTSLFGPEDLTFSSYGVDALVSKEFPIFANWVLISPYAGVSSYLITSREMTDAVDLYNEHSVGCQVMAGAVLKVKAARLGVEYNVARLQTLSFKIGVAF